jgi:uncharacterized short protein YbdD (DUF466 family)
MEWNDAVMPIPLASWGRESVFGGETRRICGFDDFAAFIHHAMQSPHPDERPAKKRRFFTEVSSPAQVRSKQPNSPPQSSPQAPSSPTHVPDERDGGDDAAALDEFDVGMLQAVVGDLPLSTLQKLKDVSGNNVERGRHLDNSVGCNRLSTIQQSTYTLMAPGILHLFSHPLQSSSYDRNPFRRP